MRGKGMDLRAKCVRDLASPTDGERLLVSRVRPRGVAEEQVDGWERSLAPSAKLDFAFYRHWITWGEYGVLYADELRSQTSLLREIGDRARLRPVTLVCNCSDEHHCRRELLMHAIERAST